MKSLRVLHTGIYLPANAQMYVYIISNVSLSFHPIKATLLAAKDSDFLANARLISHQDSHRLWLSASSFFGLKLALRPYDQ